MRSRVTRYQRLFTCARDSRIDVKVLTKGTHAAHNWNKFTNATVKALQLTIC
jgi:hypothetical protein